MLRGKIYYLLSEKGRKQSLLSHGDGKLLQVVENEVNKENIDLFEVDNLGNIFMYVGFKSTTDNIKELERGKDIDRKHNSITISYSIEQSDDLSSEPILTEIKDIKLFDRVQSFDELIEHRKDMIKHLTCDKKEKLDNIEITKHEQISDEIKEQENLKKFYETMKTWIEKNGSEWLQTLYNKGYDVVGLYITEKTKLKLNNINLAYGIDFVVDIEKAVKFEYPENILPGLQDILLLEKFSNTYKEFDFKLAYCISSPRNRCDIATYTSSFDTFFKYKFIIVIPDIFKSGYNAFAYVNKVGLESNEEEEEEDDDDFINYDDFV